MKQPGITAIAHPANTDVATTHGVFVLENLQNILKKYQENPDYPSMMGEVKLFLHKPSKERMEESGAKIPGTDQVCV